MRILIVIVIFTAGMGLFGEHPCEEDTQTFCGSPELWGRRTPCLASHFTELQQPCREHMESKYPDYVSAATREAPLKPPPAFEAVPPNTPDCTGWDWYQTGCQPR